MELKVAREICNKYDDLFFKYDGENLRVSFNNYTKEYKEVSEFMEDLLLYEKGKELLVGVHEEVEESFRTRVGYPYETLKGLQKEYLDLLAYEYEKGNLNRVVNYYEMSELYGKENIEDIEQSIKEYYPNLTFSKGLVFSHGEYKCVIDLLSCSKFNSALNYIVELSKKAVREEHDKRIEKFNEAMSKHYNCTFSLPEYNFKRYLNDIK